MQRAHTNYDVEARHYRDRELFETPIEESRLYPPDLRREQIAELLEQGRVTVERCEPEAQMHRFPGQGDEPDEDPDEDEDEGDGTDEDDGDDDDGPDEDARDRR